ncbi:MAG: sigma-70 family RNA polymerase sigma factor [Verrucomicrobia bacterium]|nr:sigma-70 family RNA polymerase sigma factor [Verrucomicrobiota bacterium]
MTENASSPQFNFDIDDLRQGDSSAWESFFETFDPLIISIVSWSKWHFAHDIRQDMAQVIRAELMRCVLNFRADSSLRYFIKRICINRCIDRIRRHVREREVIVSMGYENADGEQKEMIFAASDDFNPVQRITEVENAAMIKKLLSKMDATCMEAIELFYMKGMPYKDIAQHLKISTNTVGSRLAKCLEKLRKHAMHDTIFKEEIRARADISV